MFDWVIPHYVRKTELLLLKLNDVASFTLTE